MARNNSEDYIKARVEELITIDLQPVLLSNELSKQRVLEPAAEKDVTRQLHDALASHVVADILSTVIADLTRRDDGIDFFTSIMNTSLPVHASTLPC